MNKLLQSIIDEYSTIIFIENSILDYIDIIRNHIDRKVAIIDETNNEYIISDNYNDITIEDYDNIVYIKNYDSKDIILPKHRFVYIYSYVDKSKINHNITRAVNNTIIINDKINIFKSRNLPPVFLHYDNKYTESYLRTYKIKKFLEKF